jgi:roadblock/LC7 domain-containing protein
MKNIRVETSQLTGIIRAGEVSKDGKNFKSSVDVTMDVIGAMVEKLKFEENEITVVKNGLPVYVLSLREIK